MLCRSLSASLNPAEPDIRPVRTVDLRDEDVDATPAAFASFFFQATGEDKCGTLPLVFRIGVVIRIDRNAMYRVGNPQLLHIPSAQRCPNRLRGAEVDRQRGLDALGNCQAIAWLEEADRSAVDAGGEDLLRFATQRFLAV